MILLDTSVLIDMFRAKNKTHTFFYQLSKSHNDFSISTITHFEIFRGSDGVQDIFWTNFFQNISVIPFDIVSSNEATRIYKLLKAQNKMVDLADLLYQPAIMLFVMRLHLSFVSKIVQQISTFRCCYGQTVATLIFPVAGMASYPFESDCVTAIYL